jgi:polygalacturonase
MKKILFGMTMVIGALLFFSPLSTAPVRSTSNSSVHGIMALSEKRQAVAFAQVDRKVINVKEFGAKGDGAMNDTRAIQAVIKAAPDGSTIYFPAGTYILSNFLVNNRSRLSFRGEGRKSLIKQGAGATRIATFAGSSDIVISELAFDANGITSFGGVMFYAATRVRIENTWFMDSAPKRVGSTDRFAYVFGKGPVPSRDIQIRNNIIEDLQLEVDHSQGVVIEGNTVSRAVLTAGIGIFTVGDNAVAEDYVITRNTVIDPVGSGFSVVIDPPKSRNCIFRRITITNNQVIRKKTADYGFRIGTLDNSQATTGNVFEDIVIRDNRIRIETTAPPPRQMIFANTSAAASIVFKRLTVSGNTIENEGPRSTEYAIDLRRIQNSVVADNVVKGVVNGIYIGGDLLSNEVRNNLVEASDIAYGLEGSLGENKVTNNRIVGNPRTGWKISGLKASDSVDNKH